jgi:hypothetical protein
MSEARLPVEEVQIREAAPGDSGPLCALFSSITMDADLRLSVERDPDFFRLYSVQRADWKTLVAEYDGDIYGTATMLRREAWVAGERIGLGYAGDLRFHSRLRGRAFLGKIFGPLYQGFGEALGFRTALTAVIHSNHAAMASLVNRCPEHPGKPVYQLLCPFKILNVQFALRKKPRPSPYAVRRAQPADRSRIAAFIGDDHRRRPFGYVFDEALLDWRLANWPGLCIGDFFLAFEGEKLVGVCAPWDANEVKRFRVVAYQGRMWWIRAAFNAGSHVLGYSPLPPAGDLFRYFYLTHVSVRDDDPGIMSALVDTVYDEYHGKGYQFFSAFVMQGDPMAPAFERYQATPLPAGLYVMSQASAPFDISSLGPGRPGFEMALV